MKLKGGRLLQGIFRLDPNAHPHISQDIRVFKLSSHKILLEMFLSRPRSNVGSLVYVLFTRIVYFLNQTPETFLVIVFNAG